MVKERAITYTGFYVMLILAITYTGFYVMLILAIINLFICVAGLLEWKSNYKGQEHTNNYIYKIIRIEKPLKHICFRGLLIEYKIMLLSYQVIQHRR